MTLEQTIPSWERSQFSPGGEDAVLFFAVLGKFQALRDGRPLLPHRDRARRIDHRTS